MQVTLSLPITVAASKADQFLLNPATSRLETCPKIFISSNPSMLYYFVESIFSVGGEIEERKIHFCMELFFLAGGVSGRVRGEFLLGFVALFMM
jgi:hypothetical protein